MKTFEINGKQLTVEVAQSELAQYPIVVRLSTEEMTSIVGITDSIAHAYSICLTSEDAEDNAWQAIVYMAERGVDIVTTGMRCETETGDLEPINEPIDVAALMAQMGLEALDIEPYDI